jgi:putative tricarboxylic transport membrane protein
VQPGPQIVRDHPDVFWGLIASMYIGNIMLLVLNLPLVGLFVNLLRIPYAYLAPGVLLVTIIGVYSVNASPGEILIMAVFGVIGYVLRKGNFDPAPLLLAVVLGDRMEISLRRALTISDGDWWILLQGAMSKIFLGALALLLFLQGAAWLLGFRRKMMADLDKS